VEDILFTTTEDLGAAGKDGTFANGLVDAFAALKKASNTTPNQPVLTVNPTTADFGSDRNEMSVALSNAGAGTINVTGVDVQYQKGAGWLTATPEGVGANISRTAIKLTVNRTGLANGEYSAFMDVLVDGLPKARVQVLVRVGAAAIPDDTIYVLLLDPITLDTQRQADTDRLRGFVYRFPDVPPGSYVVVAGTDRDNDDIIAEEEDLFGVWPTLDTVDILVVREREDLQGIGFPVSPQATPFGRRAQGFRRLR
jgi:serine protease